MGQLAFPLLLCKAGGFSGPSHLMPAKIRLWVCSPVESFSWELRKQKTGLRKSLSLRAVCTYSVFQRRCLEWLYGTGKASVVLCSSEVCLQSRKVWWKNHANTEMPQHLVKFVVCIFTSENIFFFFLFSFIPARISWWGWEQWTFSLDNKSVKSFLCILLLLIHIAGKLCGIL